MHDMHSIHVHSNAKDADKASISKRPKHNQRRVVVLSYFRTQPILPRTMLVRNVALITRKSSRPSFESGSQDMTFWLSMDRHVLLLRAVKLWHRHPGDSVSDRFLSRLSKAGYTHQRRIIDQANVTLSIAKTKNVAGATLSRVSATRLGPVIRL